MIPPTTRPAESFLQRNLMAILAAAFAAYGGYVSGQTTMTARLDRLEADVAKLEARIGQNDERISGRLPSMVCIVRTLDRLSEKTGVAPPCEPEVRN